MALLPEGWMIAAVDANRVAGPQIKSGNRLFTGRGQGELFVLDAPEQLDNAGGSRFG